MKTLDEFMQENGIGRLNYGRRPGARVFTATFQDNSGKFITVFINENVDMTNRNNLFVKIHNGLNANGIETPSSKRWRDTIWIVND